MPHSLVTQPPRASSPINPDLTYEPQGYGADGSLKLITTGAASNSKGNYESIGAPTAAWCGFWLEVGAAGSSATRYLVDIRVDGVIVMPDLYIQPTTGSSGRIYMPIAIAAGKSIEARAQGSSGNQAIRLAVLGVVASASTPPGYSSAVAIVAADTAGTRPNTGPNVPLATSIAWTELKAETAASYGAILVVVGDNGTPPANPQQITVAIAVGAAGSEVEIGRVAGVAATSSALCPRMMRLIEKSVGAGSRISAAALGAIPGGGPDQFRVGLYGFV